MLNRAALMLRYKQPVVDWINAADPYPTGRTITLADVNDELTVYLIGDAVAEFDDTLAQWSRTNRALESAPTSIGAGLPTDSSLHRH